MPIFKNNSKIQIDLKNKAIIIIIRKHFNEKKAKKLKIFVEKLKFQYNFYTFIIILPKKIKFTNKVRQILMDFIKEQNLIVIPSPIQRAILKTEAVFTEEDTDYICNSEKEALNRMNI
ncbi:MAG: hypothetical protein ACFFDN_07905 [Candidatus Hodarchaeota archaeon]